MVIILLVTIFTNNTIVIGSRQQCRVIFMWKEFIKRIVRRIYRRDPTKVALLPKSVTKKLNGSLTIEASLVVPIFIFTMFMLISVMNVLRFHICLSEAIHQETKNAALLGYSNSVSTENISGMVRDRISTTFVGEIPVEGGIDGVDFYRSKAENSEIVAMKADYTVKLPYDLFGLFNYKFCAKCVMHTFVGYENGLYGATAYSEDEECVYITATGSVYHKNRDCSYIRLSIMETTASEVNGLRNSSGHKYYRCNECKGDRSGRLYITEDGTSYHSSLSCSGIKRTVISVPISKVCDRRGCSRCAR